VSSNSHPKRTWLWAAAAVLLIIPVLLYWNSSRARERKFAEIRRAGFPVTLAEWDDWYAEIGPEGNAAQLILQAANAVATARDFKIPEPGAPWPRDFLEASHGYLSNNIATLKLLDELPPHAKGRYPINLRNGANTLLPHLSSIKRLVQLLRVQTICSALDQRGDDAFRSLEKAFSVEESLSEEPILISQLVRIACLALIVDATERACATRCWDPSHLSKLQSQFAAERVDLDRTFSRAVAGERVMCVSMLMGQGSGISPLVAGGSSSTLGPSVAAGAYRILGLQARDLNCVLKHTQMLIDAQKLPLWERTRKEQEIEDSVAAYIGQKPLVVSKNFLTSLPAYLSKEVSISAKLICAETALALERFRRAHKEDRFTALTELVPEFLPHEPIDPFDGRPLRLKKTERGWLVYSVGSNLKDDEGVGPLPADAKTKERIKHTADDIVFHVE